MRYTKAALLLFGLGLLGGFVVVVGEFSEWEYFASVVMALGLVLLPFALFADGHGIAVLRWVVNRLSRRKRRSERATATRAKTRPRNPPTRAGTRRAPRRARV
jgi:hypothetical protein